MNNITPAFVDIDPYTFNLDPAQVESAPLSISVILVDPLLWSAFVLKSLQSVADSYNLKLIYDGTCIWR